MNKNADTVRSQTQPFRSINEIRLDTEVEQTSSDIRNKLDRQRLYDMYMKFGDRIILTFFFIVLLAYQNISVFS